MWILSLVNLVISFHGMLLSVRFVMTIFKILFAGTYIQKYCSNINFLVYLIDNHVIAS